MTFVTTCARRCQSMRLPPSRKAAFRLARNWMYPPGPTGLVERLQSSERKSEVLAPIPRGSSVKLERKPVEAGVSAKQSLLLLGGPTMQPSSVTYVMRKALQGSAQAVALRCSNPMGR